MADLGIKALDSANNYRKKAGQLMAAYEALLGIDEEYVGLDVGNNIPIDAFNDITNLEFTDSVGTMQSLMATIDGVKTNLYKLSDGSQR